MAQIVDAYVFDVGLYADTLPKPGQISHRLARHVAWKQEGAAFRRRDAAETDQRDRLVRYRHPVHAALFGVGRLLGPDCEI